MAKPSFWISLRDEEFELIKNNHIIRKEFKHPMFFKGMLIVIIANPDTINVKDLSDHERFRKRADVGVISIPNNKVDNLLKNRKSAIEFSAIPGTILMLTTVDGFAAYNYGRLVN